MLYSNCEYSLTTKPTDVETMSLAYSFLTEGEEITHTFDAGDIIALFTTKKIIFVQPDNTNLNPPKMAKFRYFLACRL